jgi:hypothetical protein
MGLEIIGAGLGRTGTHSLKLALEILEFGPCHHMYEVRSRPEQLSFWQAAVRGEQLAWDEVFRDYKSQVDWPGAMYWRELADHFPKARVVLTVRDPEIWYQSIKSTLLRSFTEGRLIDPDPFSRAVSDLANEITGKVFAGQMADRDHAISVYKEHNRQVQDYIAPERLLVLDVSSGWQHLCEFLGVVQPDTPFPMTNSTEEFLAIKRRAIPSWNI